MKILHFIGQVKPWIIAFDPSTRTVHAPQGYGHLTEYLQLWWNIFCADIHPKLSTDMVSFFLFLVYAFFVQMTHTKLSFSDLKIINFILI